MSCSRFELWLVADDAADQRRAEEHARECRRCAAVLAGQRALLREVEALPREVPPPPELEGKIRRALAREAAARPAPGTALRPPAGAPARPWRRTSWGRTAVWGALAAGVVLAAFGLARWWPAPAAPASAQRLLVADALAAAEAAEQEHARAIARLEAAAAPLLAGARDLEVAPQRAALLLAYQDRLAFLDGTIAEIRAFLDANPSHPGARTVLLAAYKEKTDVLREVLALEETT